MCFKEAVEDGIRRDESGFTTLYYPHCEMCGEEVMSWSYIRGKKYICKKCKLEKSLSDKEEKSKDNCDSKERSFNKAICRIEHAVDLSSPEYKKAKDSIHSKLHTDGWFQSSDEIMAAIELVAKGVKTRHQVKFGSRYRADFVLPELKVVLEIDGTIYHTKNTIGKESIRDSLIVASLGPKWEVVRIPTDLIEENVTKLLPAIKGVLKKRALLRKQYGGVLPDWYTDRKMV